ncbi:lipid asymmetry maintenance ABC transporter permease subunit MlaE [Beggiatoa leptomitoformis]|uniref:Intermembrane phospholipid transport system permease protein MlaE n=1 Tax=Beggiatoa leptomitoformis TaxID=288004 RepID=A0A2N9YHC7_9GAMM|nr:lipid asymmetry maintenance ABC transporter permease subunit MlaE [Beggiatoa leptomitoformis]ALG67858.1 lipid asymmetry maintenance ABC transporter permease subunit MlaE [Beggiatoa leptomitoformis]AUI69884.1 lipid asymmetry maintenance ABC transporter permease subunit MlaE [Beggiatoa leptomitoformis]
MLDQFQQIGSQTLALFERLGRSVLFMLHLLSGLPSLLLRPRLVVMQLYSVGVLSLSLILVSGLFVGMVLGLQGYNILVNFNATEMLGVMVSLSLLRELGSVLTAILFAGRAGSALTAEIGLMKATEQLAAMEMMAVNPYHRVMAPRFVAGVLAMPLLAAMFNMIGIFGGHLVVVNLLGVDSGSYWSQMQSTVELYDDIFNGLLKSFVFGIAVTWIAVFEGYDCLPTSEGVSRATTRTVVYSALATLALDFMLTAIMFSDV